MKALRLAWIVKLRQRSIHVLPFPLVFSFVFAIAKVKYLTLALEYPSLLTLAAMFCAEIPALCLLFILALCAALPRRFSLRVLVSSIYLFCCVLYCLDCSFTLFFADRLLWENLIKYLPEVGKLSDYLGWLSGSILILAIFCFFMPLRLPGRAVGKLSLAPAIMVLLYGLTLSTQYPAQLAKYEVSLIELISSQSKRTPPEYLYSAQELASFAGSSKYREPYAAISRGTNLILVIVESLSASDSKRTSGLNDLLPEFDEISKDGTLFTNFFGNYYDSEGGVISTLTGAAPIPYPGSSGDLYESFSYRATVAKHFNKMGYQTSFLTGAELNFLDQEEFLNRSGFQSVEGIDQVAAFSDLPRYTFDAISDEALYTEALRRVNFFAKINKPLFLTLVTTSSHIPYIDPLGREDTEENVFQFVSSQIARLHRDLRQHGFYENGILLVTGDHRKMTPISEREVERYGDSAKARIPLLLLGKGVEAGKIDPRFFQQSDLLPMLDIAINTSDELSPHPVWVERYSHYFSSNENNGDLEVFNEASLGMRGYKLHAFANSVEWVTAPPLNAIAITQTIHAQRAAFQMHRGNFRGNCIPTEFKFQQRSATPGMFLTFHNSTDLNSLNPIDSSSLLTSRTVDRFLDVAYPEYFGLGFSENYALDFSGFIKIEREGTYAFQVSSDDGVCMTIGGKVVISDNRGKAYSPSVGTIELSAGFHPLNLRYFQSSGYAGLKVEWQPPGGSDVQWQKIPGSILFQPNSILTKAQLSPTSADNSKS